MTQQLLSQEAASPTGQFIRFAHDHLGLSADESMQSFERFLELSPSRDDAAISTERSSVADVACSSFGACSPVREARPIGGASPEKSRSARSGRRLVAAHVDWPGDADDTGHERSDARSELATQSGRADRAGGSADGTPKPDGLGASAISGRRPSFDPSRQSPLAQPRETDCAVSLSETSDTPAARPSDRLMPWRMETKSDAACSASLRMEPPSSCSTGEPIRTPASVMPTSVPRLLASAPGLAIAMHPRHADSDGANIERHAYHAPAADRTQPSLPSLRHLTPTATTSPKCAAPAPPRPP